MIEQFLGIYVGYNASIWPAQIVMLVSAAVYFTIVFVMAFALGALRVIVIAPRLGTLVAVLLEVPIVLGVSWVVCVQVVSLFDVPNEWLPRLLMGGLAFLLLMIAEPAIAIFGFRGSLTQYLGGFRSTAGLIGLLGQIAFALIPFVQSLR
jgi:hypothetical protein